MPKAIALYSGGLDSILAILSIQKQNIDVTAVKFITPFNINIRKGMPEEKRYTKEIGDFTIKVEEYLILEKFLEMVKNPQFGYGKNMNPCVDCKILMLKETKRIMVEEGYDFIVTGEVLWQRPMSQRRDILSIIEKESSVKGFIVRPLSAKLLNPSYAELDGIIDREKLYDFSGRSRKPQMRLAKEFGIKDYAQPAGGCLLTDPLYSFKLKELLRHNPNPSMNDIYLLQLGRHFRFKDSKIIVGRDKIDNGLIESFVQAGDALLWVEGYSSPVTIIRGMISDENINLAASICSRYSSARKISLVDVSVRIFYRNGSEVRIIKSIPASDDILNLLQIKIDNKQLFTNKITF